VDNISYNYKSLSACHVGLTDFWWRGSHQTCEINKVWGFQRVIELK